MSWTRAAVFVSLLGVAACTSAPVEEHHYSLVLDALNDADLVPSSDADAALAVISITLPEYLRSNNLVMQIGDNEILPARRHFWAEPLDDSIKRVLTYDLDRKLPDIAVYGAPVADGCLLHVEFDRFHATDEARVVASGRYSLLFSDGRIERSFDTSRTLPVGGYANSISELRNSVSALAAELVLEIEGKISCQQKDEATAHSE